MKMYNAIHLWMLSEDNTLRLPANRRLRPIGSNRFVTLGTTKNHTYISKFIEVCLAFGSNEVSLVNLDGEMSNRSTIEWFVGAFVNTMIDYCAQRRGNQVTIPGNSWT